jgi:hypothetical protein
VRDPNATRSVTLVLCTPAGELLGALPPYDVPAPWWQEVVGVVAGARSAYGVDVTVLRLLATRDPFGEGGPVTYLAEVAAPVPAAQPWDGPDPLADQPLRLPYARPGGPDADLAWADEVLAGCGSRRTGPAEQQRTWNLSSVWRLPTPDGPVWLKVVPPFFGHEGPMLERLNADHPGLVPPLLAVDHRRVLLTNVPGGDNYHAGLPILLELVRTLVGLQAEWVDRVDELLALGAPDWRATAFAVAAADALARTADQLDEATVTGVRGLIDDLPRRFAELAECGLPDTLVHGDFHPGNTVGDGPHPVVLDWGDCGVGNPLLDQAAFTARLDDAERASVLDEWADQWQQRVPGCDPRCAARLISPVAAVRQAMIYRMFLDNIEPDEQVYHAGDPATWLRRAADLVAAEG